MATKFPCIGVLGLLGFLASCSDPVPPASQGSATLHFNGPSMTAAMAGKMCSAGTHFTTVPSSFDSAKYTTGSTRPPAGDVLIDGEQGRQFSCSVKASGDKFVVGGQLNIPAFDKDMKPLPIPTQISFGTTIGKDESGATGTLSVADNDSGGAVYQATGCSYSVKADATTNKKLAIDAGKIWGSVTCPDIGDPSVPNSSCTIDSGYFILENCDQ
jgi:hypothetical protein